MSDNQSKALGGAHLDAVLAEVTLDLAEVLVKRLLDVRHLVQDRTRRLGTRVPRVPTGLLGELCELVLLLLQELLDALVRLGVETASRDELDALRVKVGGDALSLRAAGNCGVGRGSVFARQNRSGTGGRGERTACRRAS